MPDQLAGVFTRVVSAHVAADAAPLLATRAVVGRRVLIFIQYHLDITIGVKNIYKNSYKNIYLIPAALAARAPPQLAGDVA